VSSGSAEEAFSHAAVRVEGQHGDAGEEVDLARDRGQHEASGEELTGRRGGHELAVAHCAQSDDSPVPRCSRVTASLRVGRAPERRRSLTPASKRRERTFRSQRAAFSTRVYTV